MEIHHYDPRTGEYLKSAAARLSPADEAQGKSIYLVPAFATDVPPPNAGPNQAAVWTDSGWDILSDFRGIIHYDPGTGEQRAIDRLGVSPEVLVPPPENFITPSWNGQAWVEISAAEERVKNLEWRVLRLRRDLEAADDLSIREEIEAAILEAEAVLNGMRREVTSG